jgi:spermidine synthase
MANWKSQRLSAAVVVFLAVASLCPLARAQEKVLYDGKSQFNRIIVTEDSSQVRRLYFEPDGAVQSSTNVKDPTELLLAYSKAAMCGLGIVPQPSRMLIVGLGGASMPKYLRSIYPDAQIDIAELDPDVAKAAKDYFFFREDAKMKVYIGDGRKFIETTENRYDIIFLDAYGTNEIPYLLATREFLKAVRSKLSESGLVVANVWGSSENKLYPSMVKTYRDVFDDLHILRSPRSENRILLALPKAGLSLKDLAQKASQVQIKRNIKLDLPGMVVAGYEATKDLPADAKVLVDADKPK